MQKLKQFSSFNDLTLNDIFYFYFQLMSKTVFDIDWKHTHFWSIENQISEKSLTEYKITIRLNWTLFLSITIDSEISSCTKNTVIQINTKQ